MNTNVLFSVLLVSVLTVNFTACGNKGGSGETPNPASSPGQTPLSETANISEVPNFESQYQVPDENTPAYKAYLKSRFGSSCEIEHNNSGAGLRYVERKSFDSSLRINDIAHASLQLSNQEGHRKMDEKFQVHSVSGKRARIDRTILSMSLPQAGGEILLKSVRENEDCAYQDGFMSCESEAKTLEDYRLNMTTQGYEYLKAQKSGTFESCYIESPTSAIKRPVQVGVWKLQDGNKIQAYLTIEDVKGPVVCNGQVVGDGELVSYTVSSLQVKAMPSMLYENGIAKTCGGATVVKTHVITINGKVIDSYRFEQTQPALK